MYFVSTGQPLLLYPQRSSFLHVHSQYPTGNCWVSIQCGDWAVASALQRIGGEWRTQGRLLGAGQVVAFGRNAPNDPGAFSMCLDIVTR